MICIVILHTCNRHNQTVTVSYQPRDDEGLVQLSLVMSNGLISSVIIIYTNVLVLLFCTTGVHCHVYFPDNTSVVLLVMGVFLHCSNGAFTYIKKHKDSRTASEQTETDKKIHPTVDTPEHICMTAAFCMLNSELWEKKLSENIFTEDEDGSFH